jgi:hypothetical protein
MGGMFGDESDDDSDDDSEGSGSSWSDWIGDFKYVKNQIKQI